MNRSIRLTALATIAAGALALTPAGASADAAASPTSLAFGNQNVGTTSPAQTSTVNVTCSVDGGILGCLIPGHFTPAPLFSGANPGDFAQTNTCGIGVSSSGSCAFSVTFTPTGAGARTATLRLGNEDTFVFMPSPRTIVLSGTGVTPPTTATTPAAGGTAGKSKKCKKAKKGASSAKKKCKKKRGK